MSALPTPLVSAAPQVRLHHEPAFDRPGARVLPGEFLIAHDNIVLVTVLGSCVAACIRDPDLGIGGMNHFMLPEAGAGQDTVSAPARYGAHAMEMLINALVKRGARRHRLEAKVFGGANVIPGMQQSGVGARNAAFVLSFLHTEGLPVVAQDLGGYLARKVAYCPATGEVRLKRIDDAMPTQVARSEQSYHASLGSAAVAGSVELFQ